MIDIDMNHTSTGALVQRPTLTSPLSSRPNIRTSDIDATAAFVTATGPFIMLVCVHDRRG
jgi:hypothetical protein